MKNANGIKVDLTSTVSKNNEDHTQTFSCLEYIEQNNLFWGIAFDTSLNVKNMLVYFFLYGANLLSLYMLNNLVSPMLSFILLML